MQSHQRKGEMRTMQFWTKRSDHSLKFHCLLRSDFCDWFEFLFRTRSCEVCCIFVSAKILFSRRTRSFKELQAAQWCVRLLLYFRRRFFSGEIETTEIILWFFNVLSWCTVLQPIHNYAYTLKLKNFYVSSTENYRRANCQECIERKLCI